MTRKFTFTILAMLFAILGPGAEAWGQEKAEYTELFTVTSDDIVSNSSYAAYTKTIDERGWVITFGGNNKSVGTNSGNRSKCNLSNYSKYAVSPVTVSDVASAFVSTTSISDVSKISYTFNGGSNQTNTNVYLIYSSDGNTFSQVTLTSGTQGATISSGTAYEFTKCSGYFGLLFKATNTSGAWRIDDVNITFYKGQSNVPVTGVTLNTGELSLNVGATETLTATVVPDNATNKNVTWSSNQESVATVSESGVVTAVAAGTATITVTTEDGNKTASCNVTVTLNKLATPTNLNATPAPTSAALTWDAVANASSYEVILNSEAKAATTNSLLVEDLIASTTYTWTVKAIGDGTTYADSDESEPSEFTTSALPTVAYTVSFNGNEHGTPASESITETSAGAGITLPGCTPNTGYQFVGWATTETATEAEYEAGAIYHPTTDITLFAVYNEVYTITWSVNGTPTTDGNPTTSVVKGDGITALPTAPASISGMAFQGWTATQIATSSATAPTDLFTDAEHAPAITANTTFYAVFAEESEGDVTWNNVTTLAGITEGEYVLVSEKTENSFKYMPNTESSGSNPALGTGITINNNVLTNEIASNMPWSLVSTGTTNEYYIRPYGNDKIGLGTTNSTGANIRISSSYKDTKWTIATNETANWQIKNDNTTSMYLAVYSDDAWRNYSNATTNQNGKFYFFKKTQDITYTYYTNVVVKQLTSITLSGEYPTEFWKGDAFSHEGMTVTAHYSNADDEDVTDKATFTGYDMATAGEQTVTVKYDTESTTYNITVKTIANTQETAYTIAQAIDIIEAGKDLQSSVYVAGIISQIDEFNSQYHNMTYWIEDESTETEFEVYRGKNLNNTDFNDENDIVIRANVIIYGKITKYNSTYEFSQGNYLVSYTAPQSYGITLNQSTDGIISADKETAAAGETVTITIEPASGYTLATLTGAAFNETVDPALLTYTFTMPAEEVTINATFNAVPTYTISFATNGIAETEATIVVNQGDAIGTLAEPTGTNIPNGYTFRGWNAGDVALTDVEPTYVTAETVPTGDMTLKAVFAIAEVSGTTALNKMGAGDVLNNGDNIVIVATGNDWAKALYQETVSSSYVKSYNFTGNVNDVIADSKNYVTLNTATGGKWKLGDATNGYVHNASSNNLTIDTKNSTEWTISWNNTESKYSIKNNDRWLSCRNDLSGDNQYKFRGGGTTTSNGTVYFDLYKLTTSTTTYSNFCTTVNELSGNLAEAMTEAGNAYYISTAAYVPANATVTINGVLINTDPEKLVIEDGGQLIVNNSGVKATVEKVMDKHGYWGKSENPKAGWYFLAAPMENFAVTSFTSQAGAGKYDLYRYYVLDGTPIWYNYKANTSDFEPNFVSGRGYLAAYETTNLLKMQGTLNAGTEFEFTDELNTKGNFTLLGNPFTYDLKWSDFTMTNIYNNGFAVVDSEDGMINYVAGTTPIKVGTGFMVYTEDVDAKLSFTKRSGSGKSNDILALNLFASNGNGEDNTIIVIDDNNGGFAKADNFNTNVPQIYTERLQTKYGIRNFNTSTKEFNVSFKAAGEGSNTIRLETIGEFDYVHLYDKLLDVDVDMLLEGSYTFEASEDDDTHRFIVRIDKGNTGIDENEHFAYQNGSELVVNGEGTLQIFDVLGRVVVSEEVHGQTVNVGGLNTGAYIVRLTGESVKTQKIVVR